MRDTMGARRVNLIAWNNGVGLSRDLALLADALRAGGHDVTVSPIGRGKLRKWFRPGLMRLRARARRMLGTHAPYDINIMLEHIRTEDLGSARMNFFVPNPEWCLPADVALLDRVEGVLVKTRHADAIFEARKVPRAFIGFTSEDRWLPDTPRRRAFFHLAGRSSNKGTRRLMDLWRRHPEWPTLTVVQSRYTAQPIEPPVANINHRIDYIEDAELRALQNAHVFHLCPSETEGFGHYIVEAMSVGAVTLTTDATPMNELVTPSRGLLVKVAETGTQHLAQTHFFDEAAMEAAVQAALSLDSEALETLGRNARAWYVDNHAGFSGRVNAALRQLSATAA